MSLLGDLNRQNYPVAAVIVVDSGEAPLLPGDLSPFDKLNIRYLRSEKSVCIQRNTGIRQAETPWIFLCDDDVEVPEGYLRQLVDYAAGREAAGAVSGVFLEKEGEQWLGSHPVTSPGLLIWKFIFGLGFWGDIQCPRYNPVTRWIRNYYQSRGNHIARSGWPVLTDLAGARAVVPVYTLGAALVRKDWLLQSPFDEVLDRYGIGDNFGVCLGFPGDGVHVVNQAFAYHHKSPENRLQRPVQYFRRVLALDYFIRTRKANWRSKRGRLLWSLTGNLLGFLLAGEFNMTRPAFKSLLLIASGRNPYCSAARKQERRTEPVIYKLEG